MRVVYLGRKCDIDKEAHDEKLLAMWQPGSVEALVKVLFHSRADTYKHNMDREEWLRALKQLGFMKSAEV